MRKNIKRLIALLMTITMILTVCPIEMFAAPYTATASLEGEGTAEQPYLIGSSADWDALSSSINSGSTEYRGKNFLLTDNISVTTVLGTRPGSSDSQDRPFSGTFDGAGHTLNVNYNMSGFAAPFAIAHNATIKNLKVTGTVKSTDNHASGLVAASKDVKVGDASYLNIENVTISTDISCNSHVAGVIGHAHSATITMENVVFKGSISASSVQGGFIGWGGANQGRLFNCTLKDCMFAGTYKSGVAFNPVAYASGQGNVVLTNDFYTTKSASGGSPITPTGAGQLKLLAVTVEKDGAVKYFDSIGTAASSSNWTEGSTLKLMTDVTTGSTITIPSGAHTLDLNGYGIKMTGSGSVINAGNGAALSVEDSNPDAEHKFTVSNAKSNGAGLATVNDALTSGYQTFAGGYITGGSAQNGGGIKVNGTAFLTLNAGTVIGNQSSFMGAGIKADNNGNNENINITVNGGAIIYNTVNGYGAGICSDGAVEINGGTIAYNVASNNPGGIHSHYLHLSGGSIENNFAGATDYACGAHADHEVYISGNPVVYNNLINGNPVNLDWDRTEYRHGHKLNIVGALTEGAKIGVTIRVGGSGEFTSGWKDKMGDTDPAKYFTSDNSAYAVFLGQNGEAEIGVPPAASIISGEVTTNYGSISDAVGAWTAGSTLKLLSDVTTGSTITVPAGSHTLDLNGHTVKAASAGYSVITVGSGVALVVDDTAGGGKITGGSVGQNYGGGITVDGGKLTLKGGAISGNANTYSGIGNCGGGIHVKNSGELYMEGGKISGNTSYVGGGVCSDGSATTVSITGGVIKNNTTERFASAIWAGRSSSATFKIGGDAKIIDNISTWTSDKDGEASVNFSKLSISGNPTVRGCWKTTGNSAPNAHINLDNNGSSVQRIALDGALTNESGTPNLLFSPIYRWNDLQSGKTFVFTENWSTYMGTAHPADYFGVDASVSGVRIIRKNGEAAFTGSGDLGDLYITYDANGGTGEMDAQLVSTTSAVLNQNLFTNGSKEFIGWNTKADGSGTPYSDKGDITLSGDVTLYAQWAEKHAHDDIDFKIWTSTTSLPTKAGDYYLGADVTISSTWNVPSGTVNLCLNGHGIKMTGSGSVINVRVGRTLNLYDCGTAQHYITLDNYRGTAVSDTGTENISGGTGTVKVTGGYITGGNAQDGAGVYVTGGGKFNMYGGTILGNLSSRHGGGVNVSMSSDGSEFNMYGGCVCYNSAVWGGGINIFATARVSGESLIENNVASNGGGGIELESGGRLYMNGGTVTENRVLTQNGGMWKAGGVHVPNGTEYHLQGAVRVINNYEGASGTIQNNVFVRKEVPGKVILDGALAADASIGAGTNGAVPFTLTFAYKTYMGDADPSKYFTSDNADYTVILKDGEAALEYPPVPDVSASGYTGDYDGAAHSIAVSVPTGATVQYGTKEGEYSLTENPSYTGAGTYNVYYKVTMDKHTPVEGSAVVTINQIDVTVTITGNSSTANYDGENHSVTGYTASADTPLYNVKKDFIFGGTDSAARSNAGTTWMYLSAQQFSNTNKNFATVTFNVTDGYITVNPIDVTVTITGHTASADYDGKVHSVQGYDFKADSPLYTKEDVRFNGTAKAQRTDAGLTQMGLSAAQFENTNANFANVTFVVSDGYIKITPIDITVTIIGHTDTADYSGKAHSVSGYEVQIDDPNYRETDFTFSGTAEAQRTDAGTSVMGLTPEQFKNTNSNYATVAFVVTDGYITVNPIDVHVTITGHKNTAKYDGKAHTVSGYDAVASTNLYDVSKDIAFSGKAEASQTDVGTATMGLNAGQFKNVNANFKTVSFSVTDGYQTVKTVDAVLKKAPQAKDRLVYTGSAQTLCVAGSVDGGTIYYAIGKDEKTVPASGQFKTSLPSAKEIGNYYIWYKVKGDKNHNSLAPEVFKITLADPTWVTISGKILKSNKTVLADAEVVLMSGNQVVDTIISCENGEYYFTVPAGVYNIVVNYGGKTITNIADVTGDTASDIVMPAANTDSVLNIVGSEKSIAVGGLEREAEWIRKQENIADDVNVTLSMTVKAIAESDTEGSKAITGFAKDKYIEFYDLSVEKTVGSVTTRMDTTHNVLEIAIPCSFTGKRDIEVFSCSGSDVVSFTRSDSKEAGTYYIDAQNGFIYIYATSFATIALAYQPYFSVKSMLSFGDFSGNVSVKLTKEGGAQTYELTDVSVDNISFKGVPRGTYSMTVTWTDGAENSLTIPFNIK